VYGLSRVSLTGQVLFKILVVVFAVGFGPGSVCRRRICSCFLLSKRVLVGPGSSSVWFSFGLVSAVLFGFILVGRSVGDFLGLETPFFRVPLLNSRLLDGSSGPTPEPVRMRASSSHVSGVISQLPITASSGGIVLPILSLCKDIG
jgi:hypothetical protein